MEARETPLKDSDDEEGDEERKGAVREIGKMKIDEDLMASNKNGITAFKKNKKKKKKKSKKISNIHSDSENEEIPPEEEEIGQDPQNLEIVKKTTTKSPKTSNTKEIIEESINDPSGIEPSQKKKKKKKRRNRGDAYNLGIEPEQKKKRKKEEKDYEFTEIPKEVWEGIEEEDYEFKCSCCPFGAEEMAEYKLHYKSDWHRFNTVRKAQNLFPVSEEEYKESLILKDFV